MFKIQKNNSLFMCRSGVLKKTSYQDSSNSEKLNKEMKKKTNSNFKNHYSNKLETNSKNSFKTQLLKIIIVIGIIITISMLLYVQFYVEFEQESIIGSEKETLFENSIPLLAVNEVDEKIVSSSVIPLSLKITQGEGNIFVNLNSYTELDTQISITNSQDTICSLMELPCSDFDFYYTFDDASLVLKGPSASSSIGILVYSSINGIKLDNSFAMTGNLNSNGIIGMVGGVAQKVDRAKSENFQRVYIPYGSLNESKLQEFNSRFSRFEVVESLDIINILKNEFSEMNISLSREKFNTDSYTQAMKFISDELCEISNSYLEIIDENNYTEIDVNNSEIGGSLNQINNSKIANENEEFYSRGSFCYSANIGLKNIINSNELNSEQKIRKEIELLEEKIEQKKRQYNPQLYPMSLNSLNDIYTYLLLSNRIYETQDFLNQSRESLKSLTQLASNESSNKTLNKTLEEINQTHNNTIAQNISNSEADFTAVIEQLSLAQERFTTVQQWEQVFKTSNTKKAQLPFNRAQEICRLYITENQVLNELMIQYSIDIFNEQIEELEEFSSENPYLCIFNGMQIKGRINTILLGNTMNLEDVESLVKEFQNIAQSRMEFKSQGGLPLIPYISYEYSNTLLNVGSSQSALQYIQLALAYSELNILLDESSNLISSQDYFDSELTPYQEEQLDYLSTIKNISYVFLLFTGGFIIYLFKI